MKYCLSVLACLIAFGPTANAESILKGYPLKFSHMDGVEKMLHFQIDDCERPESGLIEDIRQMANGIAEGLWDVYCEVREMKGAKCEREIKSIESCISFPMQRVWMNPTDKNFDAHLRMLLAAYQTRNQVMVRAVLKSETDKVREYELKGVYLR